MGLLVKLRMQTQGGHRRSAPGRAELDTSSSQCSQVSGLQVPAPARPAAYSGDPVRKQLLPSVLGPSLQNPLFAMTAVPAPCSLFVFLQVLWLALAQIVSPVTSLAPQSPVQSLGLGS